MLRASMSVPANLVEGVGQKSKREFSRFIRIALNSANELEYHLQVARDFDLIPASDFRDLVGQAIQVRKMLYGLLRSLDANSVGSPTSRHRSSPASGNCATGRPQRVSSKRE
jgi:four helix bundle protein